MKESQILVVENEQAVISKMSGIIKDIASKSISETGSFKVGVSGGSLVKFLVQGLQSIETDFNKWTIFFCDERVVPENDKDSTFGVYKTELIGKVGLTESQFVKIKQGISAENAALDYAQQIATHFPDSSTPEFDLLLLGMGPDGHTCSLFPGHELLAERNRWIAPIIDSPKPPPERVTMTYPLINAAKNCVFPISGEGKAHMIKRILGDKEDLPAARVNPKGSLIWILDESAAKLMGNL